MGTIFSIRNIAWFLSVVVVFFGVRFLLDYYKHTLIPPIMMQPSYIYTNDDAVAVTTLHPGDFFFIRLFTVRTQICNVENQYSIVQYATSSDNKPVRKVMFYFRVQRNRTFLGDTIIDKYFQLPTWLPPGDYLIVKQSDYDCSGERIGQDETLKLHVEKSP